MTINPTDPTMYVTPPKIAVERFAHGWTPFTIPSVWVEIIEKWTPILAEIDPDFQYQQITLRRGVEARVHLLTDSNNFINFAEPIAAMNRELTEILISN